MPQQKHKPELIVAKLRLVDVLVSQGQSGENALTADIIALASKCGRYGHRRITALLRREAGWAVNVKRVERIWRWEGPKVPAKQPKKSRL